MLPSIAFVGIMKAYTFISKLSNIKLEIFIEQMFDLLICFNNKFAIYLWSLVIYSNIYIISVHRLYHYIDLMLF